MIITTILFIISLAIIIFGANILTDGASALASRLGVSSLMIGLTIVAFGTSAPELIVSLTSSIKGNADISLGNVVGSNIFNILAVLGISAMFNPVEVKKSLLKFDIPFMIVTFVFLILISFDKYIFSSESNVISRIDGFLLIVMFLIHLTYSIMAAKKDNQPDEKESFDKKKNNLLLMSVKIVGGLLLLVYGGDLLVDTSSEIALKMGIEESIVAVTLVAAGTSVPELATSVVAAYKKESDIAIGNIVGSCIFNVLFILGLSSTVNPINVIGISVFDFTVMILSGFILLLFSLFYGNKVINRVEGFILFFICVVYYSCLCLNL